MTLQYLPQDNYLRFYFFVYGQKSNKKTIWPQFRITVSFNLSAGILGAEGLGRGGKEVFTFGFIKFNLAPSSFIFDGAGLKPRWARALSLRSGIYFELVNEKDLRYNN